MVRVKASTLVESLIAMSIIAIAFYTGLSVVSTVMDIHQPVQKWEAKRCLEEIIYLTKKEENLINQTIKKEGFWVDKKVILISDGIYKIILNAYRNNDNKLLATNNEIIKLQ